MVDVVKVLRNDTRVIVVKQVTPAGAVYTSNRTYLNKATSTASRSRLKPTPLTPTPFILEEWFNNTEILVRTVPFYGTFTGPPDYVGAQNPSGTVRTVSLDFSDASAARNRALAKATDFSFGISIAESKQTVSLLLKTIGQLSRFAGALKRGDILKAADVLNIDLTLKGKARLRNQSVADRLSSGYLEFQFGWMPLLEDASSVAKAYTKGLSTEGLKVSGRSGKQASFRGHSAASIASYVPEASASFSGRVHNPSVRDLNNLGFLNVPLIAWNLVPLSFVFDWFIPVGTFLGGMTANAGLKDCITTTTGGTMKKVFLTFNGVEYLTSSTLSVGRTVVLPIPSLIGLAPAALQCFGQVVSGAALAHQRFSSPGSKSIR